MPAVFAVQVLVACLFARRKEKDGSRARWKMKALSYILGSLSAVAVLLVRLLLLLGQSRDSASIIIHIVFAVFLSVLLAFRWRKNRILGNGNETRFSTGTITKAYTVSVLTSLTAAVYYEYEFTAGGKTYKSLDTEPLRKKNARGTALSGTQRIVYAAENPSVSWISGIDHSPASSFLLLYSAVILLVALSCVVTTDIASAVANIPAGLEEAGIDIVDFEDAGGLKTLVSDFLFQ